MIVPGRTALFLGGLTGLLLVGVVVEPMLGVVALVCDVALVVAVVVEGRRLRGQDITVEREGWGRCQIHRPSEFVYRMDCRGDRPAVVTIRQPWPEGVEAEGEDVEVRVEPGETVRAALTAMPRQRGRVEIAPAEIDVRFPVGLAGLRYTLPAPAVIAVYPDLRRVGEFDALRQSRALRQIGVHRMRRIGAGREFEQLRDYLPDDDYRDVSWKATARHRRPITTVYRQERSQDVVVCVDCGRMMGDPVGEGTALDYAVDAAVLLAHASLWQGDRIGLLLFEDRVRRFLKPKAGNAAMTRIVEELVDAAAEPVFPSYAAMASALRAGQRRRSMVFLFTDLNDPQLAADLAAVLPLVSRRHLFVVVSLRDPLLDRVASGPAADRHGAYRVLAARKLAAERAEHRAELARIGVQVLEADADSVSMEVINRYLEVKTRQLL